MYNLDVVALTYNPSTVWQKEPKPRDLLASQFSWNSEIQVHGETLSQKNKVTNNRETAKVNLWSSYSPHGQIHQHIHLWIYMQHEYTPHPMYQSSVGRRASGARWWDSGSAGSVGWCGDGEMVVLPGVLSDVVMVRWIFLKMVRFGINHLYPLRISPGSILHILPSGYSSSQFLT